MSADVHSEGTEWFAGLANGLSTKPANYYIGLCTDAAPAVGASVGDLTEIADDTYARQTVAADSSNVVSSAEGNGRKLTFATVTFTNGDTENWTAVNSAFLTDAADDSGKLLATLPIANAPRTIQPSEEEEVTFVVEFGT